MILKVIVIQILDKKYWINKYLFNYLSEKIHKTYYFNLSISYNFDFSRDHLKKICLVCRKELNFDVLYSLFPIPKFIFSILLFLYKIQVTSKNFSLKFHH